MAMVVDTVELKLREVETWEPLAQASQDQFVTSEPLHPMLFIPDSDMLFPCWNSQSFHLHTEGVSLF